MKQDVSDKMRKITLLSGIGRSLAVSFLLFALVPMAVVSVDSYRRASDNLYEAMQTALKTSAVLKTREIRAYFDGMLADLRHQAQTDFITRFLEALEDAYQASGQSALKLTKSYKWAITADAFGPDLEKFRRAFNYYDVFLINRDGDILFTVAGEKDLGANLFSPPYDSTKFSASVRHSLETGRPSFSDYERWGTSDNEVFGFLTDVIVDEAGDKIGVLAFQFPIGPINRIMQTATGLGKTAETYLVGPDFSLRSESVLAPEMGLITDKILTYQTSSIGHTDLAGERAGDASIYEGPHGNPVLGIHHDFSVLDVNFSVIAEIEKQEAFSKAVALRNTMFITVGITAFLVVLFSMMLASRIVRPVLQLSRGARRVEGGDFSQKIDVAAQNEIGDLAGAFNAMVEGLSAAWEDAEARDRYKTGQMELSACMSGVSELSELGGAIIAFLAKYMGADVGAIYCTSADGRHLMLTGTYAFSEPEIVSKEFELGQGVVGQVALEKKRRILSDIPDGYLTIRSGLGGAPPGAVLIAPFIYNDEVVGVIELGALRPFSMQALAFVDIISEQLAVNVRAVIAHMKVRELLKKTQAQAEFLKASEAELRVQEEELRETNAELEEQKNRLEHSSREIEKARRQIAEKADALELASRYKSEFLANMSHELRTPLNSILLLSKLLSDNRDGVLAEDHLESVAAIHSSGKELLTLINDVLDLSKVEAGKMELYPAPMQLREFGADLLRFFEPLAREKGLSMEMSVAEGVPPHVVTDRHRVEQVVRNFLSNAVKFTAAGRIALEIRRPDAGEAQRLGLAADRTVGFHVTDTGIGIPPEKQKIIFEAFQQADGTTSRQYGGTGLGLSIARELSKLLGGKVHMTSVPEKGSSFVLYLPERVDKTAAVREAPAAGKIEVPASSPPPAPAAEASAEEVHDDRSTLRPGERSILLIEDDPTFLKVLRDLSREQGFQSLVAGDGETGLSLAAYYIPSAVILDLGLPGIDGWAVMARLKENPATRHIPVHIVSAADRPEAAMKMGAVDFLVKPVSPESLDKAFGRLKHIISKPVKDLLVVEDDAAGRQAISKAIGGGDVKITTAASALAAYEALGATPFDCMILDLNLPDMPGTKLLEMVRSNESLRHIPIIVYTGRELSPEEKSLIDRYSESTIIKGADSHRKLLDETTLFLHRVEAKLPEAQQKILRMIHDKEKIFADRKILVVDDDMRNVYSLKKIMEEKKMRVVVGKTGKEALARLEEDSEIDLILMDIMMPEMDGYEAMRQIRSREAFKGLPIIALTAKAMKGDRSKCIEAGASDYLAKPVDVDRLLSMMRVWLYGRN